MYQTWQSTLSQMLSHLLVIKASGGKQCHFCFPDVKSETPKGDRARSYRNLDQNQHFIDSGIPNLTANSYRVKTP